MLAAPPTLAVTIWTELSAVPPFNPDLDLPGASEPVDRLRTVIRGADVVLFSTPEYAHGLPGSLKNALDWLVGSGELSRKPVVLVNASGRGVYAQAALREVLQTMDAVVLHDAETTIDLGGRKLTAQEIVGDDGLASLLGAFFVQLAGLL